MGSEEAGLDDLSGKKLYSVTPRSVISLQVSLVRSSQHPVGSSLPPFFPSVSE